MVGSGMLMALLGVIGLFLTFRHQFNPGKGRLLLIVLVPAIVLPYLANSTGWVLTEVGRQPWIVQGVMRVRDAVTPMPGLQYSLFASIALYLLLGSVVAVLLFRQVLSKEPASRSSPAHAAPRMAAE